VIEHFDKELFGCVNNFARLNGWKKQEVLICDNSDIRIAESLYKTRVKHNWPSQWHTRFPGGYIKFENGREFDLRTQTVEGKPVYIFVFTEVTEIFYRKGLARKKILRALREALGEDWKSMADLVAEAAGLASRFAWDRRRAEQEIAGILHLLEPQQLQDLSDLLTFKSSPDRAA
jgi:hypothetical protein